MKFVSDAVITDHLRSLGSHTPRVVVSGNYATPWELLKIVDQHFEHFRLFALNPQPGWPIRPGVITETPFVGPGVRQDPNLDYLPMRLSLVPRLFSTLRQPDVVLIHTSTPRNNKVSLGIEVNLLPAAIEAVRRRGGVILAQVNPHMPYTFGDAEIDCADIDLAIEVDAPLSSPVARPLDEAALVIGENVATLVNDGATLQLGIGQLPDAALQQLTNRHRLGVWSEMISDGIVELDHRGVLDPHRVITSTFLFGSPELYEWANENERLIMRRTEVANSPAEIAKQPAMVSINTALEVDLFAQSNASFVRGAIYSGFGGQPDFVNGALHSHGGHAILALRSWHEKTNNSNIIPLVHTPVTSFQHTAIVTEQGIAMIFGRSQRAQARLLIDEAAHPRARASLRTAAEGFGLHVS